METEADKSGKRINIELPDKIIEKERMEQAMKEGCVANCDFIKESSKE
ncbi:conserved domain protein [delta proteobacterium NaphS2]|nr:conserved domain protein [delta proteobacterium NaphS2]